MDDRVDPVAAAPGAGSSFAAQADTVVRKKADTKPEAKADTQDQAGDAGPGIAAESEADLAGSEQPAKASVPPVSTSFADSAEPVTVSRMSPTLTSDRAVSSSAAPALSSEPGTEEAVPTVPDDVKGVDSAEAPIAKNGRQAYSFGSSPSGKTVPPVTDEPKPSAAALAAAALAADTPTSGAGSGYSPSGFADYSPPGYSSKDSAWPASSRAATSGYPPATADSSRTSSGYPAADPPARPSSVWTSQDSVSGKVGYSPSGTQRPDNGLGSPAAAGAGAGAAGAGAGTQVPGRVVASKAPSANAAPSPTEDLVSKLKAPFATVTKKRKPAQPPKRSNPLNAATAAGVGAAAGAAAATSLKTRPATKRSPTTSPASPSSRPEPSDSRRDAQLVVSRIDPWSVMKFSFVVSMVGWIVLVVAVALLYYALRAFGVFHFVQQAYSTVTQSKGHVGGNGLDWLSASTVIGYTLLVGAVNVVLLTALTTVGSVVYNLITRISGGVEVTLREAD
ncbi:MAG TPA: DUF3566 domain-containing protein [Streptosporangiaceae bacterium]|nr:DUF3566 domain-containing protein [Streptosporangiaceae bacterium]